jgi:hypothetical protein
MNESVPFENNTWVVDDGSWDGVKREVVEVIPAPIALTFHDTTLPIRIFIPSLSGDVASEREKRSNHQLEVGDELMTVRIETCAGFQF